MDFSGINKDLIVAVLGAIGSLIPVIITAVITYRRAVAKMRAENADLDAKRQKEAGEAQLAFDQKVEELRLRQAESERQSKLQDALIAQIGDIKALQKLEEEHTDAIKRVGDEMAFHAEAVKQNSKITEALRISTDKGTEATVSIVQYLQNVTDSFSSVREQMQGVKKQVVDSSEEVAQNSNERAGEIMQKLTEITDWLERIEKKQECMDKRLQAIESGMIKSPDGKPTEPPAPTTGAVQPNVEKAVDPPKEKPSDN